MEAPPELKIDAPAVEAALEAFIRDAVAKLDHSGLILGLSGGIDSAVAAELAVRALGRDQVLALVLPERDTDPQNTRDAIALARSLGIRYLRINLTHVMRALGVYRALPLWIIPFRRLRQGLVERVARRYDKTRSQLYLSSLRGGSRALRWVRPGVAYCRAKPRVRMVELYLQAEMENRLVLGTDNKTEFTVGLFSRWGDAASDAAPLAGLYKTQVRQLAEYLGVPADIIAKAPSPDVLPGLTDEAVLGMDYTTLDRILVRLNRGEKRGSIAHELGLSEDTVKRVEDTVAAALLLRGAPLEPAQTDTTVP